MSHIWGLWWSKVDCCRSLEKILPLFEAFWFLRKQSSIWRKITTQKLTLLFLTILDLQCEPWSIPPSLPDVFQRLSWSRQQTWSKWQITTYIFRIDNFSFRPRWMFWGRWWVARVRYSPRPWGRNTTWCSPWSTWSGGGLSCRSQIKTMNIKPPPSLVELQWGSALIGRELQSVEICSWCCYAINRMP